MFDLETAKWRCIEVNKWRVMMGNRIWDHEMKKPTILCFTKS